MSLAKQPNLPLFPGDFLASTATWDGEERGLYLVLMIYQWAAGPLPVDRKRLTRVVDYDPDTFNRLWKTVGQKFVEVDGGLVNVRLEEHREKANRISEKNRDRAIAAASARWGDAPSNAPSNAPSIAATDTFQHAIQSNPIQSNSNKEKVPSEPMSPTATDRVFDHWKATHRHPRAKLDAKRRKVIQRALRDYSEADLCLAITGYLNSPHHMGQNETGTRYDDIELMLRDAKHIDAGIKFHVEPPRTDLSKLARQNVAAVIGWEPEEVRNAGK